MIEANHDQAEKQRLPLTQPAAQFQWSLLFWHLRGKMESSKVPLRQAHVIEEYIRSATTNTNEAQATDAGSICGIGSHQKVSQLQKARRGEVAGSVNVVRSLLDRQLDCCHPQASGYGVIELTPDSPDVKLKTHTQWAQLNSLCRELDIPVRFGLGLSAQKNPKLYFRVIQQTVTYARPQHDGGGSGYNKAYKLKPHDINSRPQPLAKKDFWIVKNMQRRDPAAAVFWGSWTECQTERRRRGMCEQTECQTAPTMPTSTERRERQALDYEWELLTTDAHHAYRWSCTGSSSLTQTFSFALVESAECNFPDDIELCPNELQFQQEDTTTEHVGLIPVRLPEQTNADSKRRKC